ncbi:MAG: BamA/TamA family outer membrane protein [Chitinophagales bacterium]|nr:BamA/TamA family outer membrane protein [Chitinophagales bacterium]
MNHRRMLLWICLLAVLYAGCSGTKKLPQGQLLYNGAKVQLANPDQVNNDKKVKADLLAKAIPKPNKKVLGLFRMKLWLYLNIKEPKDKKPKKQKKQTGQTQNLDENGNPKPQKRKGFRNLLKYKIGEPPVLYETGSSKQTVTLMEKYLEDNGYFRANVEFDTLVNYGKKEVNVVYTVTTEGQYFINNIMLPKDSDEVSHIIASNYRDMIVRSGQPYNVDKLKAERDKYATLIRSKGFYDFNREYIYYYVDTTIGNQKADIYFRVKAPSDSTVHTKYYIRNITVYPVFAIDDTNDVRSNDTIVLLWRDSLKIIQNENFIRRRPLVGNILIRKGNLFSQKAHTYTVNHFLDLGIFKFVNIRYDKTGADSLDVRIYLTPSETQDIAAEINASTTTTNFLGTGASFTYNNRNILKGGELLTLSAGVNVETQLNSQQSFINTLLVTGRAEIGFPKFLVPFSLKRISLYYVPRTKFGFSENFQKRVQYYTLNSFIFDYSYDWRQTQQIRHILTPFSINSIRLFNSTPEFDAIVQQNPTLRTSFEDVFIIGVNYAYTYNGMLIDPNSSYGYFRGNIDLAGNVIYPIAKAFSDKTQRINILDRPFAQYAKFDVDGRYHLKITKKQSFVNRVIAGIAIPYGNSRVTPYLKQFFIGGATSVRAYRIRTLGPGSYVNPNAENSNVFPDQTGDIKLELNTEYRFTIINFLKGAVFADAGNIWTLRADSLRPGANFDIKRFYKEIAIGAGVGLRLDFNFFVIRADVAIPLRKPELPEGERWTFDKFNFGNKDWRKDNMIWNIAIGYPF